MQCARLLDEKPQTCSGRWHVLDLNVFDSSARRSVTDVSLEALNRLGLTFSKYLDSAVRQILHPPIQSLPRSSGLGEVPKTNTLNAPFHYVPSRHSHTACKLYLPAAFPHGARVTTTNCASEGWPRQSARPEVAHMPSRWYTIRSGRPSATNSSYDD